MFEYEEARVSAPPGRLGGVAYAFVLVLIFVLWLAAGAVLVKTSLRQSDAYLRAHSYFYAKHQLFQALEREPELIFVGASLVHRHVDPAVIMANPVCADQGVDAFNFGVGAASAVNVRATLDWVLNNTGARIVLEPSSVNVWGQTYTGYDRLYAPANAPRIWPQTLPVETGGVMGAVRHALSLLEMSALETFNVGAVHLLAEPDPAALDAREVLLLAGRRGFQGLEQVLPPSHPRRAGLAQAVAEDPEVQARALERAETRFRAMSQAEREAAVAALAAPVLTGLGPDALKRITLMISPHAPGSQIPLSRVTIRGVELNVITTPVSETPALGRADHYIDTGHLNSAGAQVFSETVAARACAAAAQGRALR